MKFTGKYPDGWGGYTFLDYDAASNTFHPGDDYNWGAYNDDYGIPVLATYKGVCVYSGSDTVGYGNMIVLKHDLDETARKYIKDNFGIDTPVVYSLYGHLLERMVAVGNTVDSGSLIAKCGKSGNTIYAHLHFEIYAPKGELLGKPWRFYPSGWSKEKIKQYWIAPYPLIEGYKTYVESITSGTDKDARIRELEKTIQQLQSDLLAKLAQKEAECKARLEAYRNKIIDIIKNTSY